MRKTHLMRQVNAISLADTVTGGRPFTDAVEREDRGLVEWRREKRAGRVRFVVFGKDEALAVTVTQPTLEHLGQKELFACPGRQRPAKRAKPLRRVGQVGLQQPFELQQWLVIKSDPIEITGIDTSLGQAEIDRLLWKAVIVLDAAESLFLSGRDDSAIKDERGRRVVIER